MQALKTICILVTILLVISCSQESKTGSVSIIPQPNQMKASDERFSWNNLTCIVTVGDAPELYRTAEYLQHIIEKATGVEPAIKVTNPDPVNAIVLTLDPSVSGEEAYHLEVDKEKVMIRAGKPAGIFYGIQSLLQLMSPGVYQEHALASGFAVPGVVISDAPRFGYRGMHLDVSRNFFNKEEVKKYIDLLAMYKFNRFHWHLTDGSGWRIEIKKYPLLTQKTAFRPYEDWKAFWNGGRKFCEQGDPGAKGGYYTQDDIREVVQYAAERFITVIPEIEMPGHSEEVFVAYPELCCSGEPYKDGDYCAGKEETFRFLEDVLTEVMDLFPSEYIHIGGDEASKAAWKTCPYCHKRMEEHHLKNVDELQSYFVQRINKFLESKGRKLLGWDEILDGGLDSTATIMVWRGEKIGEEAARKGHHIVMTPGSYCYFDFYQSDPANEPEAIGGYLPLYRVYAFDPAPNDSLKSKVLGGQANLWTEYISDFKRVEYMVFPRALALSEVLWTMPINRDWEDFKRRLPNQLECLGNLQVNYHRPSGRIDILEERVDTVKRDIAIRLENERYQPEIRYTLDGSRPTLESPLYKGVFTTSDKSVVVTAAVFENGEAIEPVSAKETGYHLALGKLVTYNTRWNNAYPAGGVTALVDGKRGGLNYSDKLWQGFTQDMDVVIDLGESIPLNAFKARFMQLTGPDVYMPEYVEVFLSEDGKEYRSVLKVDNMVSPDHDRLIFADFGGSIKQTARYVKVFVKNQKGFTFTDEFVVY